MLGMGGWFAVDLRIMMFFGFDFADKHIKGKCGQCGVGEHC